MEIKSEDFMTDNISTISLAIIALVQLIFLTMVLVIFLQFMRVIKKFNLIIDMVILWISGLKQDVFHIISKIISK